MDFHGLLPCSFMSDSSRARVPPEPSKRADPALRLEPVPGPGLSVPTDAHRLEFMARGDRVAARLLIPSRDQGPTPLAILLHDQAEVAHESDALRILQAGTAIMELNWPLTGARHSPKMSKQLLAALAKERKGASATILLAQFAAQANHEFSCLLAAANTIEAIDANRIRRLDLSFSPERTTPGSGPDEELSSADQTVRRLLELEGDGFGAIEACTAVEEYLSTLVD